MITVQTRWNRHREGCTGTSATGKRCQGCGSDPETRAQRRLYALRVLSALTGEAVSDVMTCPLTNKSFPIELGEVDRADPAQGYIPGNVILVSKRGNQARARKQSVGNDLRLIAQYQADILRASLATPVPSIREAKEWHSTRDMVRETDLDGGRYA